MATNQDKLVVLLKDIGWLNESLFSYKEISRTINGSKYEKNFFMINVANQYHHSFVVGICRQSELLRKLLSKMASESTSAQEKIEIQTDINSIKDKIKPIKEIRNKVVAHSDNFLLRLGDLKFNELEAAISLIQMLVKKYDKHLNVNKYLNHMPGDSSILKKFLQEEGQYILFECLKANSTLTKEAIKVAEGEK